MLALMKRSIPVSLTCALMLLFAFGCGQKPPFEKPPIPIKVEAVQSAIPETGLRYSASLVPREQVEIAFKVGGYVQDILQLEGTDMALRDVQKGDQVTRGQVLAGLRDTDYHAKLNHAKSALEEARASLNQAMREFERADRLFQEGALAKSEHDKAREKLEVTRARVSGGESQVQEAEIQLQDTLIKAPLDAVVVARFVERGTLVAPGTKAFGVPDYLLTLVKPGDVITLNVEALQNREFRGIVTAVSPSADPRSRVFEVEVTIANPDGNLKDGMIATVQLSSGVLSEAGPVVPLNAVVRPPGDSQGYMVYVVESREGKQVAHGRRVEIGKVFGNKVAIAKGLNLGEPIITKGATIVFDGAVVTIIP
jgi:RND family efflux transporter MFP subunit